MSDPSHTRQQAEQAFSADNPVPAAGTITPNEDSLPPDPFSDADSDEQEDQA